MSKPGSFGRIMLRSSKKGSITWVFVVFCSLAMFAPLFLLYDYTLGYKK